MSAPVASADSPRKPAPARSSARQDDPPRQQLYVAGGLSAAMAAMIGLATLATLALIGWVAAPHGGFGEDIPDVLRLSVQMWLMGHHVGFAVPGGHISLLPMGLLLVPGLVVYRAGRRLARNCDVPRVRGVFRAALAIAGPYSAITGTLAIVAQTPAIQPSMVQALVAGFALAYVAGGLGVLRQLLVDKRIARRRLLFQLPPRLRSLVVATFTATVVLTLAGLVLFLVGLATSIGEAVEITQQLRPGVIGGILLVLLQVLYLPNAVIFGTSYAAGPGFAVGVDTLVAPTGITHGPLPALPMLAALPDNGPAPLLSLAALCAPFLAGALAGWQVMRILPTPVSEAAPLWGFVCGGCTGVVWGVLAVLGGGPMGAERLATLGPSGWQVGAIIALEVGLAAAIAAWFANWLHFRRAIRSGAAALADDEGDPEASDGGEASSDRTGETASPSGASVRSVRKVSKKDKLERSPTTTSEGDRPAGPRAVPDLEVATRQRAGSTANSTNSASAANTASTINTTSVAGDQTEEDAVTDRPSGADVSPESGDTTPDAGRGRLRPGRGWLRGGSDRRTVERTDDAEGDSDDTEVQFGVVYEEGAEDGELESAGPAPPPARE